jgi:hypothetical protein
MRIPPLVWAILGAGILSAAVLFSVLSFWKITAFHETDSTQTAEQMPRDPINGWLQIGAESPVPPTKIEIFREGALLAQMDNPGIESAQGGDFLFPPEGLSLGIYARWEDFLPGPRAVRFTASFEGTEISSFVLWGEDEEASGVWQLPSIELAAEPEEAGEPEETTSPAQLQSPAYPPAN